MYPVSVSENRHCTDTSSVFVNYFKPFVSWLRLVQATRIVFVHQANLCG